MRTVAFLRWGGHRKFEKYLNHAGQECSSHIGAASSDCISSYKSNREPWATIGFKILNTLLGISLE